MKALQHEDYRGIATGSRRKSAKYARLEAMDKSDIAEVGSAAINNMTCVELVRVTRLSNLPVLFRTDIEQHLPV